MDKIRVDDVEQHWSFASVRRRLGDALDAENVAISYYEVDPGETLGAIVHTHFDQEELFYVLSGTVTFEQPDGDVVVRTDEVIRFAPGDYQLGYNDGDETATVLALGAPRESETAAQRIVCPECGRTTEFEYAVSETEDAKVLRCLSCDAALDRATRGT
ncbi:MAG: cupin domain-containing protein [Haloarculaceae archaeon]